MNKKIFIVNGMARCGKDTFAKLLNGFVPTIKYSSIDKIVKIAELGGYSGGKSEVDRKFLSDLKELFSKYNDLPFRCMKNKVELFRVLKYNVLLIDIREPSEIERAKKEFNAKTVLIKNNKVKQITSNMADANVYNYEYDYIIENNGTIDEFRENVKRFYENMIKIK